MKNIFALLSFLFVFMLISSCGKDVASPDRCNATLFNEDISPRLMAWQAAATAYADDQSVANCNNYKSTGQAWLESLRSYETCTALYTQSLQESINEAQADLAALPCN